MGNYCRQKEATEILDEREIKLTESSFQFERAEIQKLHEKNQELLQFMQSGFTLIPVSDDLVFKGQISKENVAHGSGSLQGQKYKYEGEWENGKPNGFGILQYEND